MDMKLRKPIDLTKLPLVHTGRVKLEYTDAYEMAIPLGPDHTATLIVDAKAVEESGMFIEEHQSNIFDGERTARKKIKVI